MTEGDLRKEVAPEGAVLLNGKARKRATNSLQDSARTRRVIIGILPCVTFTKNRIGIQIRRLMYSGTLRLMDGPGEEKCWRRTCCFTEEVEAIGMRFPGHRAAEIQDDCTDEHQIFRTRSQRSILKRHVTPLKKSRERNGPSRSHNGPRSIKNGETCPQA